jgi:4-diphosphocytidyl-2-C-methyl-D-erythritol kinase
VNLRLVVLGKREDDYHDLQTIMQMIDLYDEVEILKEIDEEISLYCKGEGVPGGKENLAYRAAQVFMKRVKKNFGVKISIHKRIPKASGLGGGSSNAASVIMGLNKLFDLNLSNEEMRGIGKEIGADAPFFIFQKTAIVTGIGEILKEIEDFPKFWFVLVNPGFEVSTAWAYKSLNLRLTKKVINTSINELINQPYRLDKLFYNDLEKVVIRKYPVIQKMKDVLILNGAKASLMSGSGPTVFGIFSKEEKAQDTFKILRSEYNWRVFLARSI